jgi:hypothetical protein
VRTKDVELVGYDTGNLKIMGKGYSVKGKVLFVMYHIPWYIIHFFFSKCYKVAVQKGKGKGVSFREPQEKVA